VDARRAPRRGPQRRKRRGGGGERSGEPLTSARDCAARKRTPWPAV
jgi:hypothetical protein